MEEIITLDGRQFKLTVDRPLTAQEKSQTIAEIRKQTGCGTCGPRTAQPRELSTGGVYGLPYSTGPYTGTNSIVGSKGSGSTVNLKSVPNGGVAPYDVRFWYAVDGVTIQAVDTGAVQLAQAELANVLASHTLTDTDVRTALGNFAAKEPSAVDTGTGAITLNGTTTALLAGSIRFYTSIVDSCTGTGGRGTCAQYVDVVTTCVAPTCGFVVT